MRGDSACGPGSSDQPLRERLQERVQVGIALPTEVDGLAELVEQEDAAPSGLPVGVVRPDVRSTGVARRGVARIGVRRARRAGRRAIVGQVDVERPRSPRGCPPTRRAPVEPPTPRLRGRARPTPPRRAASSRNDRRGRRRTRFGQREDLDVAAGELGVDDHGGPASDDPPAAAELRARKPQGGGGRGATPRRRSDGGSRPGARPARGRRSAAVGVDVDARPRSAARRRSRPAGRAGR